MLGKIGRLASIVGILALIVALVQLYTDKRTSDNQDSAQATQISLLSQQLEVQRQIADLGKVTPEPGADATSIARRQKELEATSVAFSTREAQLKATSPSIRLLTIQENFENGLPKNFSYDGGGDWKVVNDGIGNRVLEANSKGGSWSYGRFLSDFSNGIIEYRVKYIDFADTDSGHTMIIFREETDSDNKYQFVMDGVWNFVSFFYQGPNGDWENINKSKNVNPFFVQKGTWYSVRLIADGKNLNAYVNDILLASAEDSRVARGRLSLSIGPETIAQFDDIRIGN